jgi:hypothetical protein
MGPDFPKELESFRVKLLFMEIRPSDLIQLKKDIARVREHEEQRRTREASDRRDKTPQADQQNSRSQEPSVPVAVRIRELMEMLLWGPSPSKESLEVLPEYLITVLQVIAEEPKFRTWLLQLQTVQPKPRNQQLERMSHAFRIEDGDSTIAATFDRLHNEALFNAVCQFLREKDPC